MKLISIFLIFAVLVYVAAQIPARPKELDGQTDAVRRDNKRREVFPGNRKRDEKSGNGWQKNRDDQVPFGQRTRQVSDRKPFVPQPNNNQAELIPEKSM